MIIKNIKTSLLSIISLGMLETRHYNFENLDFNGRYLSRDEKKIFIIIHQ